MKNIIKILILILSVHSFISNVFADEYWTKISSPVYTSFSNCFFIDQHTGWISGDSGIIIKTTNSGISFDVISTGIPLNIESLNFVNHTTGWATALVTVPDSSNYQGTIVFKTTNGGINWTNFMYSEPFIYFPVIYFSNPINGYLGGFGSTILYTSNAGNNWSKAFTDSASVYYPVLSIKFFDEMSGYACGGLFDLAGVVWNTTDGGRIWQRMTIGPEPFRDMHILNSKDVFLTGGDFKFGASIAKTSNGGLNWNTEFLGLFGIGEAIDFRTESEAWISLGFSGKFIYSLDTGNTWTEIYTPDSGKINDIQFIDSLNGWAVGDEGSILKYNSLVSIAGNNFVENPNEYIFLYQNYPNPFNPVTFIRYSLTENRFVTLKVYDVLGNEIAALVNEKQNRGNYNYTFSTVNYQLSSGIYYYTLSSGVSSVTKKMVVLK